LCKSLHGRDGQDSLKLFTLQFSTVRLILIRRCLEWLRGGSLLVGCAFQSLWLCGKRQSPCGFMCRNGSIVHRLQKFGLATMVRAQRAKASVTDSQGGGSINSSHTLVDLEQMVECIEASLEDDKALDMVTIDLVGKTSIADRMIVASGTSGRLVGAMTEHIIEKLKSFGVYPKTEGRGQSDWILIDAGDVIIHLFRPEVRAFYNIEKIWALTPETEGKSQPSIQTA
jgi:ribosome-associated protein